MLLHVANTKVDTGSNQNREGTKTEGGGARGRLIIMQLLSIGLSIYVLFQSGGSEMPSGKDDSTLSPLMSASPCDPL